MMKRSFYSTSSKGIIFMFATANVIANISGFVICDSDKTMFFRDLGNVMNYTKCEDQLYERSNRTFTIPSNETILDISGIVVRNRSLDSIITQCSSENIIFLNISKIHIQNIRDMFCVVPAVKILDLSSNWIKIIERESFSEMPLMTNLYLTSNRITIIESNAFSDLGNLTSLDLSGNEILGIELETLNGLTNLKRIYLANNKISFLMVGAFSGLNSLESIDLSNNIISAIDESTFVGAKGLKYLNLRGNQIKQTSFEFIKEFRKLDSIDLSMNNFEGLESGSFVGLNVSNIVLTHMPFLQFVTENAFSSCSLLESVDFSHNQNLFYIHSRSFQNTYLNRIDFSYTAIAYINLENLNSNMTVVLNGTNITCDCVNKNVRTSDIQTVGLISKDGCFLQQNVNKTPWSKHKTSGYKEDCFPKIISEIESIYSLAVGEKQTVECFAVGKPWPSIRWVQELWNGNESSYVTTTFSHKLSIHITALSQGGKYGCIAKSMDREVSRFFTLEVKGVDIGVYVVAVSSTSIVITWNKTHNERRHVVLHREYQVTLNYQVHKLKEYWKIFKISNLKPETPYEICVGSALDINDRNCIKKSTTLFDTTAGIHTDVGVVIVLGIAATAFGVCFITTTCKWVKKITENNRGVCMVNSSSREYFGDIKEGVFTYENQCTDLNIMEDEEKTEM